VTIARLQRGGAKKEELDNARLVSILLYSPLTFTKGVTMGYQPMLEPGSEEFERRMNEAYERYANSEPSIVQNERIRPEDQDFFDWLVEDA
jgi:hypothetical protein